jgi:quercetin dioxygenase-like cupin family protein
MRLALIGVVAIAVVAIVGGVGAQQLGAPRTILHRANVASMPGHEIVETVADFQPSATTGPHTHPGEMVGYVLEGTMSVEVHGQSPVTLSQGQSLIIPAGVVHTDTNIGRKVARMLATYVVEKDKPLNTPAR